jgi:putative membrane protein
MVPLLALVVGMLLGMLSGLLPGVHSNTIASVLSQVGMDSSSFAFLVVAAVGAHLAFQFFPSIFLSIPDDSVVASVLPGHRLALEGRGREAIAICAFCILAAALCSALLLPVSLVVLPAAYALIEPHLAVVLAAASCCLLFSERQWRKVLLALGVFLLAGILGVASLQGAINDSLFPLFSGLFAASGILLSFTSHRKLPKQQGGGTKLDFLPYVAAGKLPKTGGAFVLNHPVYGNVTEGRINDLMTKLPGYSREQVINFLQQTSGGIASAPGGR